MTARTKVSPAARQEARRRFLRSLVLGGAVVGAAVAGWWPVHRAHAARLRPPGALEEDKFLASCIKCGQCVQVCPVDAIVLGGISEGFGVGVPHIDAREQACDFSCDAVQCILACPTGALTHELSRKEDVRMGVAKVDHDLCLARKGQGFKGLARGANFKGLHRYEQVDRWNPILIADYSYDAPICDLCVQECPIEDAIRLDRLPNRPEDDPKRKVVVTDKCVGCGMCEMICPVEPAAITIDARAQWEDCGC